MSCSCAIASWTRLATSGRAIAFGTGVTSPTIASRLGLAVKTVGNHISAIFAKLQVATRAEAIIRAREAGLGRPPSS
jgi:DNA-binding NarL/FixJ family response regulator